MTVFNKIINDVDSFDIEFNGIKLEDKSSLDTKEYLTCLNYFENLNNYAKINGTLNDEQGHGLTLNYIAESLSRIFSQPIDDVKDYLANKILSNMSNK